MERMVCQDFSFAERLSPFSFIIFNLHAKERAQNTRELRPSTPENASEDVSHLTWLAPSTTLSCSVKFVFVRHLQRNKLWSFLILILWTTSKWKNCYVSYHCMSLHRLTCLLHDPIIEKKPEPLCHDIQVFERHKIAKGQMFFGSSLVPSFCLP